MSGGATSEPRCCRAGARRIQGVHRAPGAVSPASPPVPAPPLDGTRHPRPRQNPPVSTLSWHAPSWWIPSCCGAGPAIRQIETKREGAVAGVSVSMVGRGADGRAADWELR